MPILRTLWTAVRALWTTLALAFAGTAVLVGGSIALVLGAVAGGIAAIVGTGLLSLATNSTHSDTRFINIVTLLGMKKKSLAAPAAFDAAIARYVSCLSGLQPSF